MLYFGYIPGPVKSMFAKHAHTFPSPGLLFPASTRDIIQRVVGLHTQEGGGGGRETAAYPTSISPPGYHPYPASVREQTRPKNQTLGAFAWF